MNMNRSFLPHTSPDFYLHLFEKGRNALGTKTSPHPPLPLLRKTLPHTECSCRFGNISNEETSANYRELSFIGTQHPANQQLQFRVCF